MLETLRLSCWSFCCWFPNLLVATDNNAAHSQQWSFTRAVDGVVPSFPDPISDPHFLLGTTATGDSPSVLHTYRCHVLIKIKVALSEGAWTKGVIYTGTLPYKCGTCEGDFNRFWFSLIAGGQSAASSSPRRLPAWCYLADVKIVKMSRDDTPKEKKKGKGHRDIAP